MPNPVLSNLQGGNSSPLGQVLAMLKGGGSKETLNAMAQQQYQNDPKFRDFYNSVVGKGPDAAFQENGLDFGQIWRNVK